MCPRLGNPKYFIYLFICLFIYFHFFTSLVDEFAIMLKQVNWSRAKLVVQNDCMTKTEYNHL